MRASLIAALCSIMLSFALYGQEFIFKSGFESPPGLSLVSGTDQIALPLTSLTDPLLVSVTDSFGKPVPGHGVSFMVTSGAGSLTTVDIETDANGKASASWTLGAVWGTQKVEVAAVGITDPVIFNATTDVLGLTTEHIEQAIELDPPQGSTAPLISGTQWALRELAMIGMHEIHKYEGNEPGPYVENFYARRMDQVVSELEQQVTDGVRIWMMYNHGFLVKSPTGIFAFDLRDSPPPWVPPWSYELPAVLLEQIDILFISHEHEDHWQDRVALAVRASGGDVVFPAEPGSLFPLEDYGNVPMANQDTVTLSGFQITAYYGQHSAPNRIYEVTTAEGVRVMHTGDTQHSQWVPEAGAEPVDVMLINGWMNESNSLGSGKTGMINSAIRAQPHLMIPGHYARFASNDPQNLHLASYVTAMEVPPGLPTSSETEVQILLWGERFDYVAGQSKRLTVTTSWLPDGAPNVPYSRSLTVRGGDGNNTWSVVEGQLPVGLNLTAGGEISGIPTVEETRNFIVEVSSGDGQTDREALSMQVRPPPPVLQPDELCTNYPSEAIATFVDAMLEFGIRQALELHAEQYLTCDLVSGMGNLTVRSAGVESIIGIQNLTALRRLDLGWNSISNLGALDLLTDLTDLDLTLNSITDISVLSGLTSLRVLSLFGNSITDISALEGLTSLNILNLIENRDLSNIQPLLDNIGLGEGDMVYLSRTDVSCADVALLEAKGVTVTHTCL